MRNSRTTFVTMGTSHLSFSQMRKQLTKATHFFSYGSWVFVIGKRGTIYTNVNVHRLGMDESYRATVLNDAVLTKLVEAGLLTEAGAEIYKKTRDAAQRRKNRNDNIRRMSTAAIMLGIPEKDINDFARKHLTND